jgi:hypothetical protein
MNILFVGPYKQTDEWGRKSRALLGALKKTGNLITSRPIYFSEPYWTYNEEAEYSTCEVYDAVIQFTRPTLAVYDGRFKKNIGFFNTDTIDDSPYSTSISRMKMLDEVWVENKHVHEALKNRISDTKISLIKPYMDTSLEKDVATGRFSQGVLRNGPFRDKFIFYSIGSLGESEGAEEAVCAYISEFSLSDNCVLVYVLEKPADAAQVNVFVEACYKRIGATKTREQRPLLHVMNPDSPLPAEARLVIHKEADCFLCPNYSLNCTSLTIEAVAAQSTPIINKNTTAYELLGENGSWGVESYEEKCMLNDRSFDDVCTANETCVKPTIKSLAHKMREAYTDKFLREKKRADNVKTRQLLESDAYYDSLKGLLCS